MSKKKRFFYHYNKPNNCMTLHYEGKCNLIQDLECKVETESKWNNSQPRLVIRGWCNNVIIKNGKAKIT